MRPQIFADIRRSKPKLKNISIPKKTFHEDFWHMNTQAYQNFLDKKINATFVKILPIVEKFEASLAQCYHQIPFRGKR